MTKTSIMNVQGIEIALTTINEEDFICITDIVKAKGGDARAADIIKNWIRNRSTIEFLGLGKPNITRILKWSNLTTLEKRLDYQPLQ